MNLFRALTFSLCISSAAMGAVDFKKDIRPILKAKCYECHNAGMKQPKAGYVFDDLEKLANDIGPKGQIVPGDPERSNILDLVTRGKDGMPPGNKEKLTAKEVKLLRDWIQEGAVVDAGKSGSKPPGSLAPRTPDSPPAPLQDWTNTEGKTIKARYVRLSGSDSVVIKTVEGKSFKVPLAKLSTSSQDQAKAAAAAETRPPAP